MLVWCLPPLPLTRGLRFPRRAAPQFPPQGAAWLTVPTEAKSSSTRSSTPGRVSLPPEKTGRICRGVELDPLSVDVIVRRYQLTTGNDAVLIETGETFEALAARSHRVRLGRPFVWPVRFLTALDRSRAPADLSGFCESLAAPHKIRC